jgi:hypothetical protein
VLLASGTSAPVQHLPLNVRCVKQDLVRTLCPLAASSMSASAYSSCHVPATSGTPFHNSPRDRPYLRSRRVQFVIAQVTAC